MVFAIVAIEINDSNIKLSLYPIKLFIPLCKFSYAIS